MQKMKTYGFLFALALVILMTFITVFANHTAQASSSIPATPTAPRKVALFVNQSINQGQTLNSSFITVTGYSKIAIYVSAVNADAMYIQGQFSIDGTNGYPQMEPRTIDYTYPGSMTLLNTSPTYGMTSVDVLGPKFMVAVSDSHDSNFPSSATFSVTLYLIP